MESRHFFYYNKFKLDIEFIPAKSCNKIISISIVGRRGIWRYAQRSKMECWVPSPKSNMWKMGKRSLQFHCCTRMGCLLDLKCMTFFWLYLNTTRATAVSDQSTQSGGWYVPWSRVGSSLGSHAYQVRRNNCSSEHNCQASTRTFVEFALWKPF